MVHELTCQMKKKKTKQSCFIPTEKHVVPLDLEDVRTEKLGDLPKAPQLK